ncbi:MarR family transcriptional regulator [Paraburkholderia sp. CNPSo 3155]|uniref:MarR family winged helix-turn-helix transcriptional regulator n=1 Tax=Paraburkholderia atlantica TaxID=2654982 RepID=UPI00128C6C8B|nr:MarR family transcriptional regulator [Paraburkholderia atlantica]MPW06105.1 MarR family transcriptional regulator [Paraburkholderia atlantica]
MFNPFTKPGALIRRLQQVSVRLFAEETKDYNMTSIQFGALQVIADRPGIDQITLCQATDIDRTSIMRVLERLKSEDLITKEASTEDRRVSNISITEAGRERIDRVVDGAEASQVRLLAPLTPDERKEFMRMMIKLVLAHSSQESPAIRDLVKDARKRIRSKIGS